PPTTHGRDPEPAALAARLGDPALSDRRGPELPGPQLLTKRGQEPLHAQPLLDVVGRPAIHARRARAPIAPHPRPGHHQEGRVADEVAQILKPARGIVRCPPVQLALDPEYPRLRLLDGRPRRAVIQRRPPRVPVGRCKPAAPLRHVPGFPRLGLLRELRPHPAPSADAEPRPQGATPDGFPRSLPFGRRARCPAFPLRAWRAGSAAPDALPRPRPGGESLLGA